MVMKTQPILENSVLLALSPDQRRIARDLWSSLMPAPSREALLLARQALQQASPEVRNAVTTAIALLWARGRDAASVPNPFE
jgi:hypothetical protein